MSWHVSTTGSRAATVVVPPAASPAFSVVIVTYGTGEIVVRCLRALLETAEMPFEVIVVDNPTTGGMPTAARLGLVTSGVRLITSDTNLGFGGGNELGVAHARGAELCLMNPDVVVSAGWLPPLLAAVEDPTVGIAAPLLLRPDGSLDEAGQTLDRHAITRPRRATPAEPLTDVDFVSAACWVMHRRTHEVVGGFDAAYHGTSTRLAARPALAQQAVLRRRWAPALAAIRGER